MQIPLAKKGKVSMHFLIIFFSVFFNALQGSFFFLIGIQSMQD